MSRASSRTPSTGKGNSASVPFAAICGRYRKRNPAIRPTLNSAAEPVPTASNERGRPSTRGVMNRIAPSPALLSQP